MGEAHWCAHNAPRGINPANHPGGIHVQAVRGFGYQNPAGAIVHAWMFAHWYTYMFEVRRAVEVPGTATPAKEFPGTNAIWGKCSTPTHCQTGIQRIGNMSNLTACKRAVAGIKGYRSFAYFHLQFGQPAYKGLCYGLTHKLTAPRAQVQ